MTRINSTTKKGIQIISDLTRTSYKGYSFEDVYKTASSAKWRAWHDIERRASSTPGYENNLHIVGASSHFFSTIYSYIEDGMRHIIYDTHCNTYEVVTAA